MRPVLFGLWCVLLWVRPFISGILTPQLSTLLQLGILGFSLVLCLAPAPKSVVGGHGAVHPPQHATTSSWAVGVWLGIGLIAIVASPEKLLAGKVWLEVMAGAAVIPVLRRADHLQQRQLIIGLLVGAMLISALALLQALVILPLLAEGPGAGPFAEAMHDLASRRRALGPFPHPNLLAGYLVMMMPLAVGVLASAPRRGRFWSLALSSLIAMELVFLLPKSLGALFALAGACTLVMTWSRIPRRRLWVGWLLTSVVVIGALFIIRPVLRELTDAHNPFRNRLAYWQVTASIIREHPVRGAGLGQFQAQYEALRPADVPLVLHAHNSHLELWAEMGLAGLFVWLWVMWEVLRAGAKRGRAVAVAGWAFVLHNLVAFSLYVPQVNMLWWLIAGLALANARPHTNEFGAGAGKAAVDQ